MNTLTVGAIAVDTTPLDFDGNRERAAGAVRACALSDAEIVCAPELCLSGYGCQDYFYSPWVAEAAWRSAEILAKEFPEILLAVGLPYRHRGRLYNACAVLHGGRVVALVPKRALAKEGVHYEPRWFEAWPAGATGRSDHDVPIGDLLVRLGDVVVGFEICEEAWAAVRTGGRAASRGADVIVNPSASHFEPGKLAVRRRQMVEGSRAFGAVYAYSNLLGCESGRTVYDGDAVVASCGEVLASAPRFSFDRSASVVAAVDLDRVRSSRGGVRHDRYEPEPSWKEVVLRRRPGRPRRPDPPLRPAPDPGAEAEVFDAVTLGLRDYSAKSGTSGFVVSLSGGADSSAVTTLAAAAVTRGAGAGAAAAHRTAGPARAGVRALYQATLNSSAATESAARELASSLGVTFYSVDVSAHVAGYVRAAEECIGGPLAWDRDDAALQNVQNRCRVPLPWLLANRYGSLLLSTGNLSEAAAGYLTMDGDSMGGFAPIAGLSKSFVRVLLRWMEEEGPADLGPFPGLRLTNRLEPSAELRPPAMNQRDEEDLMPYEVLDYLREAFTAGRSSPADAVYYLNARFGGAYDAALLARWAARFFRLFRSSQWKRERLAPSFHLDPSGLDPKGCGRFPILTAPLGTPPSPVLSDTNG